MISSFKKNQLTTILILVMACSFVFAGIGSNNRSPLYIAKVGDLKVTYDEYNASYNREKHNIEKIFDDNNLTEAQLAMFKVREKALASLINKKLIEIFATDLNMDMHSDAVMMKLMEFEYFADESGRFNHDVLDQMLERVNISKQQFYYEIKRDMTNDILMDNLFGFVQDNNFVSHAIYQYENQKRIIDLVTIPESLATDEKDKELIEGDIESFYRENIANYVTKELRKVEYILIPQSTKDDPEAQENLKDLVDSIEDSLMQGDDLSKVAQDYQLDFIQTPAIDANGYSGDSKKFALSSRQFLQLIFEAELNSSSEVIPLQDFYIAFNVTEIIDPITPDSLDDVRVQVTRDYKKSLQNEAIESIAYSVLNNIKNKDLHEVLKENDLLQLSESIEVEHNHSSLSKPLVHEIFLVKKEGDFTPPVKHQNHFVIAKVKEIIYPLQEPNEEEVDDINAQILHANNEILYEELIRRLARKNKITINNSELHHVIALYDKKS